MKALVTVFTFLSLCSSILCTVVVNNFTNPAQCSLLTLSWSGGTPPYLVGIRPGVFQKTTAFLLPQQSGTSVPWVVNLTLGTAFVVSVVDSTFNGGLSSDAVVQPGSSSCLSSPQPLAPTPLAITSSPSPNLVSPTSPTPLPSTLSSIANASLTAALTTALTIASLSASKTGSSFSTSLQSSSLAVTPSPTRQSSPVAASPKKKPLLEGIIGAVAVAVTLIFLAILLLCRRRWNDKMGTKSPANVVPYPQLETETSEPYSTVESEVSFPRDRKVRETRSNLERQIAAGQAKLDVLQRGSDTIQSNSAPTGVTSSDEVSALRQLVGEMRLEMEMLRLRERRETTLTLAAHDPPPEYEAAP